MNGKSLLEILFLITIGALVVFPLTCKGGGGKDTDGEGMPDEWEIAHGLDPTVNDALLDLDRDGVTNLEEYLAGTDPFVPNTPVELCNELDDDGNELIDEIWLEKGTPCGNCGAYGCSNDGLSLVCRGQGPCSPGENKLCGTGGLKTCSDDCEWGECFEPTSCTVGEQEEEICGYCDEGIRTRICGYDGKWMPWGECGGEGCRPGERDECTVDGQAGRRECSTACEWGECIANCNPGEISSMACGNCGGTRSRTCMSNGTWSDARVCVCEEQTGTMEFEGYGEQTRTCGMSTGCEWTPWTHCTEEGAECDPDAVEMTMCGCGGNGLEVRICSEICVWSEWSECTGDFDALPPSTPVPGSPGNREVVRSFPITVTWSASTDNCGLSDQYAYELLIHNGDYVSPVSYTVETNSTEYQIDFIAEGTWLWQVRSWDAAGNVSEWNSGRIFTYSSTGTEVFNETFEGAFPGSGWIVRDESDCEKEESCGGSDYWGISGYRYHSGSQSAWCAAVGSQENSDCGEKTEGEANTAIHAYDIDMAAYLERSVNVSGYKYLLILGWWYWLEVADANDCLLVRVQDENDAWTDEWEVCADSGGWVHESLDLSEYAGQSSIAIQFRFVSDGSGHCAEGAYVDEIVLDGW